MADVAHHASGPAGPKPGDIAPQQASRADSPDKGKLRVFISYSRDDLEFADQLDAALNTYGFECLIDRHGISGGEDWKRRLGNLISEADTVVFVLSPNSARSEICDWEVEEATRLGKRILPVICQPLEGASPPSRLQERNYIFFRKDPKAAPGAGFGTGLASLIAALNTDFDWLREHTRYLQRATEWDRGGRPANRLLSGDDIAEAKAWVARRPKSAPEPTALHRDFIRASEEEAETRLSAQRKQLEEMAAAQAERETALRQAEEQRAQTDQILASAMNIIVKVQSQLDAETQKEMLAVFQRGADHGDLRSMVNLGISYESGHGVAQDYAKAREWYAKAADKGHARAMRNLGSLYANGQGVAQDHAKAREWFEKAAEKGHADAMHSLGLLYHDGDGVAQDYAKAREWYAKAAEKGHATAMNNLGVLYAKAQDYAKACEWYERAADKGDANAMRNFGRLFANGYGVPQDFGKAREWYEKAADKGLADAMNNLGALYANGEGVAQDYAKAREWFEKAADKGDAGAKAQLERLPIREAVGAGRYADALQLQEALVVKVEEVEEVETTREGKATKETARALIDVVWYALLAREFPKALTVADRSHALFPEDLIIETNRAHALMFVGQHEGESKALYIAHKGKPLSEQDARLWEKVVAEDFAEFRKAGLTHPMMADIEKELGVSPLTHTTHRLVLDLGSPEGDHCKQPEDHENICSMKPRMVEKTDAFRQRRAADTARWRKRLQRGACVLPVEVDGTTFDLMERFGGLNPTKADDRGALAIAFGKLWRRATAALLREEAASRR